MEISYSDYKDIAYGSTQQENKQSEPEVDDTPTSLKKFKQITYHSGDLIMGEKT